jgi:hypothetical protein
VVSNGKRWKSGERRKDTFDDLVGYFGAFFFLVVLDYAVSLEGVGDGAVEAEIDSDGDAVGGHDGGVHLHTFFGAVVFGIFVPSCGLVVDDFLNSGTGRYTNHISIGHPGTLRERVGRGSTLRWSWHSWLLEIYGIVQELGFVRKSLNAAVKGSI